MTRSRMCLSRWVEKKSWCVKLVELRAVRNCLTWESLGSSRWRMRSPVIRNSWGVVAARDKKVTSTARKIENGTALRDFVLAGGGRCTLKTVSLQLSSWTADFSTVSNESECESYSLDNRLIVTWNFQVQVTMSELYDSQGRTYSKANDGSPIEELMVILMPQ